MTIKEYDPAFFADDEELDSVMYHWGWGRFKKESGEVVLVRRHHFNIVRELYKMNVLEDNGEHPLAQWSLHSTYHWAGNERACHCGQQHIKRISRIRNVYNGSVVDNVGSTCILEAFSYNGIVEETKAGIKKINKDLRDAKKARNLTPVNEFTQMSLSEFKPWFEDGDEPTPEEMLNMPFTDFMEDVVA